MSTGKLRRLWDSLIELCSSLCERRLEKTVLRSALLPVITAQFTQFFRQVWRHTVKSLNLAKCIAPLKLSEPENYATFCKKQSHSLERETHLKTRNSQVLHLSLLGITVLGKFTAWQTRGNVIRRNTVHRRPDLLSFAKNIVSVIFHSTDAMYCATLQIALWRGYFLRHT